LRTLVIVNPHSRSGATARRWRRLWPRLREALPSAEVEHTRAARDAERIAREGVRAGIERLVVAGGDGTLNEVASGLLSAELGGYAQIGLLRLGTGGDFARMLRIPRDLDAALACIAAGEERRVDAGHLCYRGPRGDDVPGWFVNVASAGIAASVEDITARTTRALGGSAAFAIGAVRGVLRHRAAPLAVRVDGETLFEGPVVLAAVANGRYFGGGMAIGGDARADDGWLEAVVVPELPKWRLLGKLPSLYRGAHLSDPSVRWRRGRVVELDGEPGSLRVEADGDPRGSVPARMEVVPGALRVIAPKA